MAIYSKGENSRPDIAIAVWLVVCCLFSTALNPIVFLYTYKRPNTIQRVVFRMLASLDFIICLLVPAIVVNNALKKTDCVGLRPTDQSGPYYILRCGREATAQERLYGAVAWPCVTLPPILTAVLTAARLYHIRYPFRDQRRKEIITALLVICAVQTVMHMGSLVDFTTTKDGISRVGWWAPLQMPMNGDPFHIDVSHSQAWAALLYCSLPFVIQGVGLIATILTIRQVTVQSQDPVAQQAQRSATKITHKILLMNMGSLVNTIVSTIYLGLIVQVVTNTWRDKRGIRAYAWTNILFSSLGPCLISAINPLIFIAMTPDCLRRRPLLVVDSRLVVSGVTVFVLVVGVLALFYCS